jgi:hypothetical protein
MRTSLMRTRKIATATGRPVPRTRPALATLIATGLLALLVGPAALATSEVQIPRVATADGSFSATKTVTRTTWIGSPGNYKSYAAGSNTVTVKADHTLNLRGRERVSLSWTGAHPSGGRAANPFGENGLKQEYPVVVMQCRGVDSLSAPAAKRLSPETCWTSTFFQRSQVQTSDSQAIWRQDPAGTFADPHTGMTPYPNASDCPAANDATTSTHLTPFVDGKGKVYAACTGKAMPPEAAVGAAYPPAEVAAFTNADGSGDVKFEVRTDIENESLGCNYKTACSIVVIPIMGTSCAVPTTPDATPADLTCRKQGKFVPGSSNFANSEVDKAVSPELWWTPSNWANRITIPVTFGLPPDACNILDTRAPTGFYGSELLAQAALQWAPAYCLSKARFKYQHNQMPDAAGFQLMKNGGAPAAVVSSNHDAAGTPLAYAPTAVTGFGIGYIIDKPDNAGELTDLKLNARLLAKLLTESYVASDLGRGHPGMSGNPVGLNNDPEFIALNPGLSQTQQEVAGTLLSLSESSDVVSQLTDYIKHDAKAMEFIHGKPDPWGMVINPSYKNVEVPQAQWPLLDTYKPSDGSNDCRKTNPTVYLNDIAAPVTKLNTIAQALVDAWPNIQTRCDLDVTNPAKPVYKVGRTAERQTYGARFMLGVVSLGDAARFGLHTARLETSTGKYVGADDTTMAKAVALMKQAKPLEAFTLDQAAVRKAGDAYPGTMPIYTVAKTSGLDKADAAKVAMFIRISTTEGQHRGSGNGQLPAGFLPLVDSGATKRLFAAAQTAARVIALQQAPATAPVTPAPAAVDPELDAPAAPAAAPAGQDAAAGGTKAGPAAVVSTPVVKTAVVRSRVGYVLLPILLGLGLVGSLFAGFAQVALARRK